VGEFLSNLIFNFDNSSAINFTGFLTTLALFWAAMVILGAIFKKLGALSGLGIIDKLLGFIFGSGKFFLITAVIAHAMYNIKAVKNSIDDTNLHNSILFPILVDTGAYIMKIDPVEISQEISNSTKELTQKANDKIQQSTKDIISDTKKQLNEAMPDVANGFKDKE
jgi:membrane protein required for colicin V production